MPAIYFGRSVGDKAATPLAVETPRGYMEPCKPSDFKVFAMPNVVSPVYSLITKLLGHLIATLSYPTMSYLPLASEGANYQIGGGRLPFTPANFGFSLKKGCTMSEDHVQHLERHGFRTVVFTKLTVWLCDNCTRDVYSWVVQNVPNIHDTSRLPDRYLNPSSFQSYLTVIALTTKICEVFHFLCVGVEITEDQDLLDKSKVTGGTNVNDYSNGFQTLTVGPDSNPPVEFESPGPSEEVTLGDQNLARVVYVLSSSASHSTSPMAIVNTLSSLPSGLLQANNPDHITAPGKILKYNAKLSLPDPNLIGDVIGRRFLTCLGSERSEQFDNLQSIKSGLSALRLTPLGNELAHLYKCLDIAIECQSGCVPFFHGSVYEGCVIMGGPGADISIGDQMVEFEESDHLKVEFSMVSEHSRALRNISNKFPEDRQAVVRRVQSMAELRSHCLTLAVTSDTKDSILRQAAFLEFGQQPWVLSPARLDDCFSLMSNLSNLKPDHPVSRLCLFSTDPVMVALSCFGEKSTPSWDIPQGTKVVMNTPNPPVVPASVLKGGSSSGQVNDASWVMVVRVTDLISATEEFRRLGQDGSYRSISSVLAKKNGMRVFSRDRMSVFWKSMREAFLHVNPDIAYSVTEDMHVAGKRAANLGEGPGGSNAKKPRRMAF